MHERRLAAFLDARFPGVPVALSHRSAPVWREHERTTTTVVDAFLDAGRPPPGRRARVGPRRTRLRRAGVAAEVERRPHARRRGRRPGRADRPVRPRRRDRRRPALRPRRRVPRTSSPSTWAARAPTSGSCATARSSTCAEVELEFGLPIATAAIDLVTLGAGGGSIAWVDDGGLLRVGPQSAGAVPGPACYGLGGADATVTDANLVLGRIDPGSVLDGALQLDAEAAREALAALGRRLGLDAVAAAEAVVEVANEGMAGAIRRVAVERGVDPRDFELVAFGGAGPLHAAEIAASLDLAGVVVPPHPGLDVGVRHAARRPPRRPALDALRALRRRRRPRARRPARRDGAGRAGGAGRRGLRRRAGRDAVAGAALRGPELRARGAAAARPVRPSRPRAGVRGVQRAAPRGLRLQLPRRAARADPRRRDRARPAVRGPRPRCCREGEAPPPRATRDVRFGGETHATPVFRRESLPAGAVLRGPAVVEELDSTTLVLPGQELRVLADGILRLSGAGPAGARREVDPVTVSVIGDQLVQIAQEMGTHMMRAAYSPIFSESRDLSCALFDERGRMIAQGRFNPAHLGAIGETVRCVLAELGTDAFGPGDVVLHNDPFRGGCHMPEHLLIRPVFHARRARRLRGHDRAHGGDRRDHGRLVRRDGDGGLPGGPAPPTDQARACGRAGRGRLEDHPLEPPHAAFELGRPARDDRLARARRPPAAGAARAPGRAAHPRRAGTSCSRTASG